MTEGAVLLLGGRSEIGLEVAAAAGRRAGRGPGRAAQRRAGSRGGARAAAGAAACTCVEFDADDTARHPALLAKLVAEHGPIGVAVVAFGILGDQALAERDPAHAVAVVHTDYVAQVSVLTVLATLLRAQGRGQIWWSSPRSRACASAAPTTSTARPRPGWTASPAASPTRSHGTGVHLLLVRSGFVIGRMTEGMSPAPLSSTPDQVADAVVERAAQAPDRVWVPGALRPAYFVARLVPQAVWRRMPR